MPSPKHLAAKLLAAAGTIFALGAYPACDADAPDPFALQITSLDQAIGGPVANARVGDFLLQNDKIKVVIEGGRVSHLPLDVGGSIIDMDLVRSDSKYRGGKGLDQLGQIMTVGNLNTPRATDPSQVRITKSPGVAQVTAAAEGDGLIKLVNAVNLVFQRDFVDPNVPDKAQRFYTEYDLRKGEQLLRITTTVGYGVPFCPVTPQDGCNAECDDALYDKDCHCPKVPDRCTQAVAVREFDTVPDGPNRGLLDIFLGDLPRPLGSGKCTTDTDCDASKNETCTDLTQPLGGVSRVCRSPEKKDAGVFIGDTLLFGGHLSIFVPGTGYDSETDIRRLFDKGGDTLATPLQLPEVYAVGDKVSYGYGVPKGLIQVPIFGGPFALGATGGASCRHDQKHCLTNTLVRGERWLAVGMGDTSSVHEVLARASGRPIGKVHGQVLFSHSGKPALGTDVFAMKDPRDLACDGACQPRCPLNGVDDAVIASWSVEQLFEANRCRTPGDPYVIGIPAVEQVAKTDPGTDTLLDAEYTMVLPPGRHVLVAMRGTGVRSALTPVTIVQDQEREASIAVVEPGRLEYNVVDERGQPTAARLLVGQCFPHGPCALDSDCSNGETCEAGSCACQRRTLTPLELGGSRLVDGVLTYTQTGNGRGSLELPPGTFDLVFSHGPHSTVDQRRVTVRSAAASTLQAQVERRVDTRDWVPADFHVHAENSIDSGSAMTKRVDTFLAEDMQFLSSSDHDILSDYEPLLVQMGVRKKIASQIGVEVTTQEIGHFIGYPMHNEQWRDGQRLPGNDAPQWREKTPGEIFEEIRKRQGDHGPIIVDVPHPYTYFDYYRLDPASLEPQNSVLTIFNPLLLGDNFSGEFDAMELINSKALDLIRRPTIAELRFYSQNLDNLLAEQRAGKLDEVTLARRRYQLATETVRRILHRTSDEQHAAITGAGNEIQCKCGSDGDCAAGSKCDPADMTCKPSLVGPGGPPPAGAGLCRSFRGVIDDWFNMLNRGVRRIGVGGSDAHGLYDDSGVPRTMLRTDGTTGPNLKPEDISAAIRAGHSVVTNGPMIDFKVDNAQIGDTYRTGQGQTVTLQVRVQKGPFYDVDRVEIYKNGELLHWATACGGTRREGDAPEPHGHHCVATGDAVVAYEENITDVADRDAWYVVIALGLDGRPLAPVYSSVALARFGTFEITQRLYDLVPTLGALRTPRFPSTFPTLPVGITNPIWIDVGGDGWTPLAPPPGWCWSGHDIGCN